MEFFKKVVFSTLYGTISQSKPHAVAYRGSRDDWGRGGHPPPGPVHEACLERTRCGAERTRRARRVHSRQAPRLSRKGALRGVEQLTGACLVN